MAKVDIISGFLGAGKTTLIKKLLAEGIYGNKVVLIENEFGEIGIDGGFLKDSGVNITEMNSGCICCTLVGDFGKALNEVIEKYDPERIIIEPSGVGKLSDVIKAVQDLDNDKIQLDTFTTVVDAGKCKMYLKNFGEFFENQVQFAKTVILSRTQLISQEKLEKATELIRGINADATIITTPWDDITAEQMVAAMEKKESFEDDLLKEAIEVARAHHHHHHHDHDEDKHEHHHHHDHDEECDCHDHEHHHDHDEDEHEHHHHHHHHDHDEECDCHDHEHHHDHDHDDDEHEHHHHHDHEEECGCHDHEHHHDHDEDEHEHHHHHDHGDGCTCGCHDHDHHADEVFTSWGQETAKKYTRDELDKILEELSECDDYGYVLRTKGFVPTPEGIWLHFDLTPGEYEIREGAADVTGRICVIGSKLKEDELAKLFGL
jgi:G3E family GTPase